ncbi:hypothetical protein Glove_199g195 [Diversispora epigaea]|uniref:Uncharacterized protein n=1 Tax=Diversispora epigaea TaxID=1348612 RepID=A0A397IPZ2_9GLOM|nr:hypothetical protein Glove_199g195 [Diversispora epigaea]
MDLFRFPSSVQVNAMILQSILREMGLEGSIRISVTEMEYEERPYTRISLFLSDLQREGTNLTPLPIPSGDNWEEQVAYVYNEINQLTSNTKHDEQLLHYYQLGFLMSQRGFSTAVRNRAKTYLLSNRLRDFWEISRRAYLLYNTRGTWNILGTKHITCYTLRHMSDIDFQGVILQEAADAKIKELINFPSDF